jgi:hypothetical protein
MFDTGIFPLTAISFVLKYPLPADGQPPESAAAHGARSQGVQKGTEIFLLTFTVY